MSAHDRDSRIEELLSSAMHDEADTIVPTGDGLSRIQERIAARRSRLRFFRPVYTLGAAAVVGVAGLAAYLVALPATPAPSSLGVATSTPFPSTTPTATTTVKPKQAAVLSFPTHAFYPFTSAQQERSWESSYAATGADSWHTEPVLTAQLFVQGFVQQPSVSFVLSSIATRAGEDVTLGDRITGAQSAVHPVTVVHLVKYGRAWLVVGADDAQHQLSANSPAAGALITSPLRVTGPGYGTDEGVTIDVRSLDSSGALGTPAHASFGAATTLSATVRFAAPPDAVGALVMVEPSAAGTGQPGRIAAVPVRFAASTGTGYPAMFAGAVDDRVALFNSTDGALASYLTAKQPGPVSDPQMVAGNVYFLESSGACGTAVMSVPQAGGTPATLTHADTGYTVTGYAVSSDASKLALFEQACLPNPAQPRGELVSRDLATGAQHTIRFAAFPPMVDDNPSWEPDGAHLDAAVRTGNQAAVLRYQAFTDTSSNGSPTGCSSTDGLPTALNTDGNGTVWVALQTGSSIEVVSCRNNVATVAFTIAGSDTPANVDSESNGRAVLVTDTAGKVWRWAVGAAGPTLLSTRVPQASW